MPKLRNGSKGDSKPGSRLRVRHSTAQSQSASVVSEDLMARKSLVFIGLSKVLALVE